MGSLLTLVLLVVVLVFVFGLILDIGKTNGLVTGWCLANGYEERVYANGAYRCLDNTSVLIVPEHILDGELE